MGICLGMQIAMIEFALHALKLEGANSSEFDPQSPNPVIDLMEGQKQIKQMGGTMRLGSYECVIKRNSLAHKAYQKTRIFERHRHRWEFNSAFRKQFEKGGMQMVGKSKQNS